MRPLAAIAVVSLLCAAPARAACLQPDDMRVLLSVALPDAIEGLAARCAPVLPAGAYLPSQGAALAQRFRREVPVDTAKARRAIETASGQDLSFLASDDSVTRMAHDYVGNTIRKQVPTEDCGAIDGLISLAAPMRADAMAEMILLALQLAGPDAMPGLSLCGQASAPR